MPEIRQQIDKHKRIFSDHQTDSIPKKILFGSVRIGLWVWRYLCCAGSWLIRKLASAQNWDAVQIGYSVFATLLVISVCYRLILLANLYIQRRPLFGFRSADTSFVVSLQSFWNELVFACLIAAIVWVITRLLLPLRSYRYSQWMAWVAFGMLHLVLWISFTIVVIHYRLMIAMNTGFTYETIIESMAGWGFIDTFRSLGLIEWLFLFMPWLVFWVLFLLPDAARIWRNRLVWSLIAAIAMVQLWPAGGQRRVLAVELQSHPVLFMISDIVRGVRTDNQRHTVEISPYSKGASPALRSDQAALNRADPHREQQPTVSSDVDRGQPLPRPSERDVTARLAPVAPTKSRSLERSDVSPPLGIVPQEPEAPLLPHPAMISPHGALTINPTGEAITRQIEPLPKRVSELQSRSLRLIEPYWIDPLTPPKYQLPPQQSWNVLLVVLESTGFQYIFDRSRGIRPPMPFLEKLSKQGWWLKRHFSPSNSSARSLFSIMSSIYPRPQLRMFSMQKDASVPSLASFLRRTHDSFLVIPSPLTWFFPQWFLRHSGLDEIYGYHNLPVRKQSPGGAYAKDERESMNFFIQRIKRATQPFFATYFSFIPHWPYPDYGPDTHVFPNNRSILRYYNNLALLDQLLEQLFEQLQSSGMMERTIVVITGDHGEAFGQHPGNWTHSRQSFNENFQVPALFYQPKLFSPRVIDWFTNHVDIVPTLLDTMRIPYDERLLQGESLWQHRLRRKYMFLYGNENTLTSISRDHIKLQYSFKHRYCWVYNLKNDPDERKRLGCKDHLEQMRATLLYHQHQIAILERYNRVWQSKPDFFGAKHPNLGSVSP